MKGERKDRKVTQITKEKIGESNHHSGDENIHPQFQNKKEETETETEAEAEEEEKEEGRRKGRSKDEGKANQRGGKGKIEKSHRSQKKIGESNHHCFRPEQNRKETMIKIRKVRKSNTD